MERPLLVYTTFPDEAAAAAVSRALVERGLAACVNLIPGMRSVYSWQGAIEEAGEIVGLVKTRSGLEEAVAATIRETHPYETPVVLTIPVGADAPTTAWLMGATGA
ncbi:divalent-cation tolerance protein CutA [Salinarimonas ramus]|uniref:Dihydroorotate dehydrogenase n=1 Tax=Salinarimonas ramus TaxID=690164 RepID=A0A917Q4V4_9HYPH|nr:divalent-cation tolerance protein CutA [Salinarimonas ramus]GGK24048.1 dihydroorotate dehydrogenase [Salinarimonas ramus]